MIFEFYFAQNISEVNGDNPLGTFTVLYVPSDDGYKIRVGNLSGRVLSDFMEANVSYFVAPAALFNLGYKVRR